MERDIFEPEHDVYRESFRSFLARDVIPHYEGWDAQGIVPRSLFTAVADLGGFAAVPEEYGGFGLRDFRYNAILIEEAAYAGVGPALMGPSLHADVCMPYLLNLTNEEQKQRWLPGVAAGESIIAVAMTEPNTGSDLAGIRTRAVREGDHYIVDGAKTFISNGVNADLIVTAVRTGDHPHRGLSLLVVERDTVGFERGRTLDKLGQHAQDTAELFFDHARVPASNLLGAEGEGFAGLSTHLPQERLCLAVTAVAAAQAALAWTIEYVRQRHAFGKALGEFQATRFRLADVATEIEIVQTYVDRCIVELNAGRLTPVDAAKAKLWATETQGRVVDACLQLHGGYGYIREYPVARAFVDARVTRIYGGTSEVMKEIISRSLEIG